MIHYSGYNDIYRIYTTTQQDGVDFNLAHIGKDFSVPKREDFDPGYMRALFDYSYVLARSGYKWHKAPPAFEALKVDEATAHRQTQTPQQQLRNSTLSEPAAR